MKMTAHLAALLELLLAHCSEKIVKARRGILDSWRGVSPVGQPRDKPVADFGSVAAADTSPGAVQEQPSLKASAGRHGNAPRGFEFDGNRHPRSSTPALREKQSNKCTTTLEQLGVNKNKMNSN